MMPTEDEMDALNDVIRRLRAELERVREAGRAVVHAWENDTSMMMVAIEAAVAALEVALEGEEGK